MSLSINVSNGKTSWSKELSKEEYKILKKNDQSRNSIPVVVSIFFPVRSNNLCSFAKDFFLPTTVNHAIKVKNVVGKIFAILGSLILDVIFFPMRLLRTVPRVIANSCRKDVFLLKFLKKQTGNHKVPKSILRAESVYCSLKSEKKSEELFTKSDGSLWKHVDRSISSNNKYINFIEIHDQNRETQSGSWGESYDEPAN